MNWNISKQVNHLVRVEFLGVGEEVTPNTMNKMKDIINSSIKDFYVRRWAEKIVENAGKDDYTKVDFIYNFLVSHVKYLKDPHHVELLKTPKVSLQLLEVGETPSLDCDCMAILSLSLIKSIGIPVALRATSYKPDGKFSHVYGLVFIKSQGWVPFDLVKFQGLGWEAPNMIRVLDMEV